MFAKSLLKPLFLAATLMLLNGCATYALWENHDSRGSNSYSLNLVENDSVVGFARVKPDSQKLPPNSIVMLGESYIYVLTKGSNPRAESGETAREVDLGAILNVKLSQPFQMYAPSNDAEKCCSTPPRKGFRLATNESKQRFCSTDFDLVYQENPCLSLAERRQERTELRRLQFRQVTDSKGASRYARTIRVCGQLYARPSDMNYDYRFETPLPVTLHTSVTKTGTSVSGGTVGRALATPFTAAVDIVTLPVSLPMLWIFKNMHVGF
ncbi:hypothetical protein HMPREF3022_00990 [Neisseria sp. HMSC065C04]|uniref:hypothetical protein n=1 Tax=Neisseria sp. HMSC065C04 TaxID=1739524 RepID=UPI0008A59EC8|nr:hypothetical protein [Neisseria sp. HMSC065C04]OFO67042.1 hypothetical protein HMPREF3022_00990 [Neisseria sp. HMSC065C04]